MDCPFSEVCSDRGTLCHTCKYSFKESYYEPSNRFVMPWWSDTTTTTPFNGTIISDECEYDEDAQYSFNTLNN